MEITEEITEKSWDYADQSTSNRDGTECFSHITKNSLTQ